MNTDFQNPNWGGVNRGQGRHPLNPDDQTKRVTITLPASYLALLRQVGDGNASKGARLIIEYYQNSPPPPRK